MGDSMQKTILITGCSSGIGLCAAETLQKRGYRVFATARKESDVRALATRGLESLQLDVRDSNSINAALTEILKRTGGTLYALFNNAGFVQAGAVEDLSAAAIREQFETNVFGAIELTNGVIPIMRKQGYGRIIQNSSMLGVVAFPFVGAYNASKFALDGFTHTLRQELRGTGIKVSIIAPGPILSQLRTNADQYFSTRIDIISSPHKQTYERMAKRYKTPELSKKDQRVTLTPEAVVADLIHALESSHPKSHYYVGFAAKLFAFLRRVLPERSLDWLIAKASY